MHTFPQDLRFGLRTLIKNPGFTTLAIVTLALGIGVNTGIFSVVNAVLLRPLPYNHPDSIVAVWEAFQSPQGRGNGGLCLPRFRAWHELAKVFDGLAMYQPRIFVLKEGDTPERVTGMEAGADFFSILGVEPLKGRTFAKDEDQPDHDRVVVLSYGFWKRRFGANPDLVGKTIALEGGNFTVIGVMPPAFQFPVSGNTQLWTPFVVEPGPSEGHSMHSYLSVARLKPGISVEQGRSQMEVLTLNLEKDVDPKSQRGVIVNPLLKEYVGWVQPVLMTLCGAVAFVLLIASANVSNLLLARAMGRRTEVAIRSALGAGRGRLIRQFLTESAILATVGAGLGLALSYWTVRLIKLSPYYIPRLTDVTLDAWMLGICVGLSVIAVLLFGLLPAIQAARSDLQDALKDSSRGSTARLQLRGLLVVGEVALTLVLLIGAALMLRSLFHLQQVKAGFQPAHLLTMRLPLPVSRYPDMDSVSRFYRQVLDQVASLPSVQAAGMISRLPPNDWGSNSSFSIEGRPPAPEADQPFAEIRYVTPNYFAAMGIPLLRGRFLGNQDAKGAPPAIVINETLARRYFHNENPIGARINGVVTIVGVVGDVKNTGLARNTVPELYSSYLQYQEDWRVDNMYLLVRTALEPNAMVAAIRAEIKKLDPAQSISAVRTMDQVLDTATVQPRFQATVIGGFAAMALLISMVGLYGVIAYSVVQRTHEIGIRMALGASRTQVMGMVVRQGLQLSAAGIGVGILASFALTRVIRTFLYDTSPTDPLTFLGISALVVLTALLAAYIPALRATRVDPMVALRYE